MFGKIYDTVMRFLYGRKIRRLFFVEIVTHLSPFDWHRLKRVWNTYKKVRLDFDREDILKVANCLPQGGLMLGEIVLEECADIIRHKFLKLTNQYDTLVSKTKGKFVDLILYLRFLNYDEFLQIREWNRPTTIMNVVNVKGKIDNKQNLLPLQFITPSPTKDFLKYYKMFNPHLMKASDFFFKRYEARIDVKEMTSHTYITGRNGSGKTELMKSMIFEFLKERGEECSMVVIDPHGDLSEQISRFGDKDRERFVLFDPYLSPPHTPIFNPFDMEDATLDSIAIKTQNLVKALEEVLKGTEFTNQMLTLLESTIPVLLEKQGSNFLELQRFFDDTRNADLVALGQQSLNAGVKDFFTNRFLNPTYTITKNSLYTKLQSLLNHPTFYKTVNGKSSINLAKLSNSKHHIVFNLSKGRLGDSVSNTIGRLLVAEIQSLALGRVAIEQQERVPTYVFIDEFQNFVSPSIKQILTEARKFWFHLIVASQVVGQDMTAELKNIILSNTNIKLVGMNSGETPVIMSKETGADLEDLRDLQRGEFIARIGAWKPFKFRARIDYLNHSRSISDNEFEAIKQHQLKHYYVLPKKEIVTAEDYNLSHNDW